MNEVVREPNLSISSHTTEPIAIVGMSCRFPPNADTLEKYWSLLQEGRTTATAVPERRWQSYKSGAPRINAALSSATRLGSYLEDVEGFDADFFGISAREAECIDPQQRIILELSWEALEHAGIVPSALRGTDVGVYMAANSFDYGHRLMASLDDIKPWTVNGAMLFGIANRVSYALDFRGPSMVVDTACAGSLTVLHLACQALWQGEIPAAIVGGVNVMSNPGMTIALDAAGATAPDGRSKAFDRSADGYGRGEGAGVVVLRRLSDALGNGERILALIRGSGVFQDGRTAGMMAPNGDAQEAMLRSTYARFDVDPATVGYVEAHGTGTKAGDQAEVGALSRVFGASREGDAPCLIGSAKPNIGHLEAGAGMAGLIKTVLALGKGVVPPSVHDELNPEIDWARSGLQVVSKPTAWPERAGPRRAGVSCFGVGGTIAHAIVEEAPAPLSSSAVSADLTGKPLLFPISARSLAALRSNAVRLQDWLDEHNGARIEPVASTLAHRRDHLSKRAAIVAATREELLDGLQAVSDGEPSQVAAIGQQLPGAERGPVWVFSGHGAQWEGMAKELLAENQAFLDVIDNLAPIYQEELGYSARQAIEESDWSSVERIQALTFAIQVGLTAVWHSLGLRPGAVIGHSVGEVAAAVTAGALELRSAARFACRRAKIYQRLAGRGGMAMVRMPFEEVAERLRDDSRVVAAIAASPLSTVISGDNDALDELITTWKRERIVLRRIAAIDAAFHSPQIDELLPEIRKAAADLVVTEPTVAAYTTTYQDPRSSSPRDSEFWATNSRGAVLLVPAVTAVLQDGYSVFLEVSSAPIVAPSIRETAEATNRDDIAVCSSLSPNRPEQRSILASLASVYSAGCDLEWTALIGRGDTVDLPPMAWQRRNYWPEALPGSTESGFGHASTSHTLLGRPEQVRSTPPVTVWRTRLDYASRPYPGSHPLFGVEIVPAAVLLHSLMNTLDAEQEARALKDISLITPVPVSNPLELQVVLQNEGLQISTKSVEEEDRAAGWSWTTHTSALIDRAPVELEAGVDLLSIRARCAEHWDWQRVEALYRQRGIGGYGFPWRMQQLLRGDGEIVASFSRDPTVPAADRSWAEVLDAALTIGPLLLPDDDVLRMPSRIDRVALVGTAPETYTVHAYRTEGAGEDAEACALAMRILDPSGRVLAEFSGLVFGVLESRSGLRRRPADLVFVESWEPLIDALPEEPQSRRLILVTGAGRVTPAFAADLKNQGVDVTEVSEIGEAVDMENATVVVLGSGPLVGETLADAVDRNAWALLEAARRIGSNQSTGGTVLACVTFGVKEASDDVALAQASLWGISRIVAGERPDLWHGLYDLPAGSSTPERGLRFLQMLALPKGEDVVAFDENGVTALRLKPGTAVPTPDGADTVSCACQADASYLVTGGLGALGLEAAHYLAERGARRLILAGRRGLPARESWAAQEDPGIRRTIERILELERLGVTVVPLQIDITDELEIAEKLSSTALGFPAIRGIVHAAGVFEGGMIGEVERDAMRRVMAPKVTGGLLLHQAFPPGSLDFFIQFSSSGQFARLTGQASYAASNAFLDALARLRNAAGGTRDSLSLGWMAWRGLGMSRSIDATMIEARGRGLDEIDTASALAAWHHAERLPTSYAAIFSPVTVPENARLAVLSEALAQLDPEGGEDVSEEDEIAIPTENRFEWLVSEVRKMVAAELKLDVDGVEVRRSLVDMGVDSLMTVALRVRLRRRFGFEFPPTLLWNSPSVYAIAQFTDQAFGMDEAA